MEWIEVRPGFRALLHRAAPGSSAGVVLVMPPGVGRFAVFAVVSASMAAIYMLLAVSAIGKIGLIVIYAMGMLAALLTFITDPGVLPPGMESGVVSSMHQPALNDDDHMMAEKKCPECQRIRPSTAIHCYMCGVCVDGIDHHCVVLGCCVAERNLRYFLAVLVVGCAGLWWAVLMCVGPGIREGVVHHSYAHPRVWGGVLAGMVTLPTAFIVPGMLVMYVGLFCQRRTYRDYIQGRPAGALPPLTRLYRMVLDRPVSLIPEFVETKGAKQRRQNLVADELSLDV